MVMVRRRQLACMVVVILCWALLATAARGNCRDECIAGCNGWAIICYLSCNSACLGEVGISTMNTATPLEDQQGQPPSQSQQQAEAAAAHSVSLLRGVKPDKVK